MPTLRWTSAVERALRVAGVALALQLFAACTQAQGVLGYWSEPTGSVIRVDRCGPSVCMWIVTVSNVAPATTDMYNPNPKLRNRSLCGLKIGSGFTLRSPNDASNGTLYDPKSGRTYHGTITAKDTRLELRGYIGIPLFGRSQTWKRPDHPVKNCGAERAK